MRPLRTCLLATLATLLAAPAAGAHTLHTVSAGETLWSIAAQQNLTTRTLAAYNGVSADANVILGSTLKVPTVSEGAAALAGAGIVPAAGVATTRAISTVPAPTPGAPPPLGAYIVRPGDTLTGLAAQTGVSVAQMAYVNGLKPTAMLIIGTVLKLPSGAPAPLRASEPAPAARVVPAAAPLPT